MKYIKRIILAIPILVTAGILFRGWLYRHLITYRSIGQRSAYSITDHNLATSIDINMDRKKGLEIEDVIKLGLSITAQQLNFTAAHNDIDPNKLIYSKTAHCVGYASFFATTCNYLLKKNDLADHWQAQPQIGQFFLLE